MAQCLTDQGFPANWDAEEGAMVVDVASGQDRDYDQATQVCTTTVGAAPTPPPWTDQQLEDIYRQSLDAYSCLQEQGYDPPEPPTLQRFLEVARPGVESPWYPHFRGEGLPDFPDDVCPQPSLDR